MCKHTWIITGYGFDDIGVKCMKCKKKMMVTSAEDLIDDTNLRAKNLKVYEECCKAGGYV